MSFLLDTNVVSEWTKPRQNPGVVAFLSSQDESVLFLSVVTIAELRRGVSRLPDGARRDRLNHWLTYDLPARFEGRLLGIDGAVADAWGRLMARSEQVGRSMGAMDGWIAATASVHALTLVSRNVANFAAVLGRVENPWTAE